MSWWTWLAGDSQTVETITDGAVRGVDALVYTDEERAQAGQKILDWKLEWLRATNPQNVARRLIAVLITVLWVVLVIGYVAAQLAGQASAAVVLSGALDRVDEPFQLIMVFYFAVHALRGWRK